MADVVTDRSQDHQEMDGSQWERSNQDQQRGLPGIEGTLNPQMDAPKNMPSAEETILCNDSSRWSQHVIHTNNQTRSYTLAGGTQPSNPTDDILTNSEHPSTSSKNARYEEDYIEENKSEHPNIEDDPWDTNIFDDIELDEVTKDKNKANEASRGGFDHTWNQDGNMNGDEDTSNLTDEHLTGNQENERAEIMEEDVENFLENEKQSAEQDTLAVSAEMKPEKGMEFKSREEAQQYFNMYK